MQMPDVNILIDAWHTDSQFHERASTWLRGAVESPIPLGLSDIVLSGAVRILTNRRIPGMAWPLPEVLEVSDALVSSLGTRVVLPSGTQWTTFASVSQRMEATGDLIPDCYLAALAIENNATFVSRDRFFSRVAGLDWIDLPGA